MTGPPRTRYLNSPSSGSRGPEEILGPSAGAASSNGSGRTTRIAAMPTRTVISPLTMPSPSRARELCGEPLADQLLDDAVGEHQAAGDREMREDGADQPPGAEEAGPRAVEPRDGAAEPDALEDRRRRCRSARAARPPSPAPRGGPRRRSAPGRGRRAAPSACARRAARCSAPSKRCARMVVELVAARGRGRRAAA